MVASRPAFVSLPPRQSPPRGPAPADVSVGSSVVAGGGLFGVGALGVGALCGARWSGAATRWSAGRALSVSVGWLVGWGFGSFFMVDGNTKNYLD